VAWRRLWLAYSLFDPDYLIKLLGDSIPTDYLSVAETCSIPAETSNQDDQYREAIAIFGHALDRLACAYEADPDTPMRFHAGHPSGPMAQFRKL